MVAYILELSEIISDTEVGENSENEFSILFERATNMAAEVGMEPLEMPRTVGRQTLRSNVEADTPEEY